MVNGGIVPLAERQCLGAYAVKMVRHWKSHDPFYQECGPGEDQGSLRPKGMLACPGVWDMGEISWIRLDTSFKNSKEVRERSWGGEGDSQYVFFFPFLG